MRECLRLAGLGRGSVSPNPLVGAVLVRHGKIIGRGHHARFGGPHAEVRCLRTAGARLSGSTLYVNLEPCSYYGKTPPCTDLIISAGVREVFAAMRDPNPLVAGAGIRKLRAAGITVHVGLLEEEARRLNRAFIRHITSRRPYVHLKIAQSLDGMIAGEGGSPRRITSIESRALVYRMRAEHDAILVGARTIRVDDPLLTVHSARGRSPHAVILDGHLSVSSNARVFRTTGKRLVIVCTTGRTAKRKRKAVEALKRRGVNVLEFDARSATLSLRPLLQRLYRLNIGSILVEGGRQVFTQFVRERCVDEVSIFIAPKFLEKGVTAFAETARTRFSTLIDPTSTTVRLIGGDILLNSIVQGG
jgi:diaminohydroxyphosphoribosylaminopyrimidine deaminase/5-amino-6-(5-phosphoribosylamino)uracil reductase